MSKDKYPSIFSPQMEAIVFIILQIFYATRAVIVVIVVIAKTKKTYDKNPKNYSQFCLRP